VEVFSGPHWRPKMEAKDRLTPTGCILLSFLCLPRWCRSEPGVVTTRVNLHLDLLVR